MECLNELKTYVPRHMRLGVCTGVPEIVGYQEQKREIPIVDDDGAVVETRSEIVRVPAVVAMAKYKFEDFRLSALQKAGVPLKMVNVNRSRAYTISELEKISENIDNQEQFVNSVLQEREQRKSWFAPEVEETEETPKN